MNITCHTVFKATCTLPALLSHVQVRSYHLLACTGMQLVRHMGTQNLECRNKCHVIIPNLDIQGWHVCNVVHGSVSGNLSVVDHGMLKAFGVLHLLNSLSKNGVSNSFACTPFSWDMHDIITNAGRLVKLVTAVNGSHGLIGPAVYNDGLTMAYACHSWIGG